MKLARIEIKNYRSIFRDADGDEFVLELGDGVNAIVGPNNCGKSNVLRAVALALDPNFAFNRARDMPSAATWAKPVTTLTFTSKGRGPESTLLKRLAAYERAVKSNSGVTHADDGVIKLRVSIEGGGDSQGARRTAFVARGAGARKLADDHDLAVRARDQFDRCVRFVMIESGQSLESVLEGKFREILRSVVADHLRSELAEAQQLRGEYLAGLRRSLLAPLTGHIRAEVADLFPEIADVELEPAVRPLDETLARMGIFVTDAVRTELADKGTGVRGGVLVAMLRYLADHGRRSMVFAIEEPEAFLHPAGQELLRSDLEGLARRDDVSVVVTTHSPFILSRQPDARVFALTKDQEGRTILDRAALGSEPQAPVLGGLFRDRTFADLLERTSDISPDAAAVVVVEGETDTRYARAAARASGRFGLVEDLHFVESEGAAKTVVQALVLRATTGLPVAVVLDEDEPGKSAQKMLTKEFGFQNKREVFGYRLMFRDQGFAYEAEDLWPRALVASFVSSRGEKVLKRKERRPDGEWQYDILGVYKGDLATHIERKAVSADCDLWITLLERLRDGLGLPTEAASLEAETDLEPTRTNLARTVWPLPGGRGAWKSTLRRMLAFVESERPTPQAAVRWLVESFAQVNSERVSNSYWQVPVSFGLVTRDRDLIGITDEGADYLREPRDERLLGQLLRHVAGVVELTERLQDISSTPDELLEFFQSELGYAWETANQIVYRLRWLESVGAVVSEDGRWSYVDVARV